MQVEVRHLRAFVAVAEELNFTRAAERLHLAQQALSSQIQQLEQRMDAQLFQPLHVHARKDEVFYVLEGKVTFMRGVEHIEAGPGSCVVLPRGIQHGFAVQTPTARMLVMTTPAGLEDAFRTLSEPAPEGALPSAPQGPPDPAQAEALSAEFARHVVTFVGPPLRALLAVD